MGKAHNVYIMENGDICAPVIHEYLVFHELKPREKTQTSRFQGRIVSHFFMI